MNGWQIVFLCLSVWIVAYWLALDKIGRRTQALQMSRLLLQPGDIVVLTVPGHISKDNAVRLKEMLEARLPGNKAIVLGDGLEMKILSPTAAIETAP